MKTYLYNTALFFGFFILIMGMFSSCGPRQIFRETSEMEEQVWTYNDSVSYMTDIHDTVGIYDMLFYLNHAVDYPFQNVYFSFRVVYPDQVVTLDTLSITVSDKMGQWAANCNGESCVLYTPLVKNIRFKQAGKHQFTINQFTRVDSLKGINEIGLLIEEAKK